MLLTVWQDRGQNLSWPILDLAKRNGRLDRPQNCRCKSWQHGDGGPYKTWISRSSNQDEGCTL